jgi:TIR domain
VADVFISYSSYNRAQAAKVAHAIEALGLDVWWDRELVVGQAYDRAIEKELDSAACVVVLWSAQSVDSEWVRNEAAAGLQRGVLVPASLDGAKLPLEFRRRQTADLSNWTGDPKHEGFQALHRAVLNTLHGKAESPAPVRAAPTESQRAVLPGWRMPVMIGIPVALVVGAIAGYSEWKSSASVPAVTLAQTPALGQVAQGAGAQLQPEAVRLAVKPADLADSAVGEFFGAVISDSKGSSRSHITVVVEKIGPSRVRASSPYGRIGTVEVELSQSGQAVFQAEGDTGFALYTQKQPHELHLQPRGELIFTGERVR